MKRVYLYAAFLELGICNIGSANAQSSVTLYGIIDAGITYVNNAGGHSLWANYSSRANGQAWGFRGAEDLGAGLQAVFTLENGFNSENGSLLQSGRMFGRQAFVGISSQQYGAVTLGRQYESMVDYLQPLSLTGTMAGGTLFSHPFDNDNINNTIRINNSVKYVSPNWSGFNAEALYGFSNLAGSFTNNRAFSFGASYVYSGLKLAAAYLQMDNDPNDFLKTATSAGAVTGEYPFMAGRQRTWGAGVNYGFGAFVLGFLYTQTNLANASLITSANSGTAHGVPLNGTGQFQNFETNFRYTVAADLVASTSYTFTRGNLGGGERPNWNQVNLKLDYLLSKRTDLYLQGGYQHVTANQGVGAQIAVISPASSTNSQVAVTGGLRVKF